MCLKRSDIELEGRAEIGFTEAVLDEFSFLESHHFKCVTCEPTYVRFEAGGVFIDIYHGRSSFEIGVDVGLSDLSESYSLSELIRIVDIDEGNSYRKFVATTPELVRAGVKALRENFVKHTFIELIKDQKFFAKLRIQKELWKESFSKGVLARQVRPKAEAAFHRKDYEEAVGLYESISDELTPAELKKLEYARRHTT